MSLVALTGLLVNQPAIEIGLENISGRAIVKWRSFGSGLPRAFR